MTYTTEQIMQGLINYADSEVLTKLPTSGKWIVGTAIGIASTKASEIVENLRANTIVNMLGLVDENGNVDVDAIVTALKSSADRYGKITVNVPLVGKMTFSSADVDEMRNYIV